MEEKKYIMSYISDKNLYKAVMLACKIIREKHWFNYAINSACKYYGVEEDTEKASYLIGYIIQKMHRVFRYMISTGTV